MKKQKIFLAALAVAVGLPAAAQDTYESARLLGSDLNGTARYVGMGGAMEALGADISTIGTNPAGIGLFRHSTISVSAGLVSQQDVTKFDGLSKTNMSFDQAGFVYSGRISRKSYVNFAFNYHKSRNFDQILSVLDTRLNGQSLNGLTYRKAELGTPAQGGYQLGTNDQGDVIGWDGKYRAWTYSQLDYMNANVLLRDPSDNNYYAMDADGYNFDRAHRGYISNFDFNISGNSNDRIFWGLTVGVKDVRYKGYSEYTEGFVSQSGDDLGVASYGDERRIKGTGFDITAGIIFRPVDELPLRFGLSVATPTWYDLTTENSSMIVNGSQYGAWDSGESKEAYDFRFYTPWKFGVSVGHTIGTHIALGASYEFTDYGASQNRVIDGVNSYGNKETYTDELQKRNAEKSLKGVHTVKLGVEVKPVPEFAVRLGYNVVTAAYDQNGYRDMLLNSPGVMYASTADYTNWKATNRITAGLGYKAGGMNIDLGYQYSGTDGDFYPMQAYTGTISGAKVSKKRHQVLLTLGYTF